ncbi:hypothetical protein [Ferroglobus placidus]|nr:hypothetical protein [Ferroglobus placidus]
MKQKVDMEKWRRIIFIEVKSIRLIVSNKEKIIKEELSKIK